MRDVPPDQIVAAMGTAGSGGGPLVDGWVIPDRPYDLLQDGQQNQINVMVGGLADEYFGLSHLASEISKRSLKTIWTVCSGNSHLKFKRPIKMRFQILL